MKHMRKLIWLGVLTCCLGVSQQSYAEGVHYGDWTTAGMFDGDLIIIGGNLDLKSSFTLNGDLKIVGGKVVVTSSVSTTTNDLYVYGDVILTNTNTAGENQAGITITDGNLFVSGSIYTKSKESSASLSVEYDIEAGKIVLDGYTQASIASNNGSLTVGGDIVAKSDGDASLSINDSLKAASIRLHGKEVTSAYISVGNDIDVVGPIITKSENGPAYVSSAGGFIKAGSISTNGQGNAYVLTNGGNIEVAGDICTNSTGLDAYVYAPSGFIKANNVFTKGQGEAYVQAGIVDIFVDGDIRTKSNSGNAYVNSPNMIFAKNISTSAYGNGYITSVDTINVMGQISTKSNNGQAYVYSSDGDIKSGVLITQGSTNAYASSTSGSLIIARTIQTKSFLGSAYAHANSGDLIAENVFTDGDGDSSVYAGKDIIVDGIIKTKSSTGAADVSCSQSIKAGDIYTESDSDSSLEVAAQSINILGDIRTECSAGGAYINAVQDLNARSIKTSAPSGQDDSIKANSGHFQFIPNIDDADHAVTIKDAEFDLDSDYVWNTVLTLQGTCTLNGKGHRVTFDDAGGIVVDSGSTLFLKNILLDKVGDGVVRCSDDTATLSVENVTWTQTSDYQFSYGTLQCLGDLYIKGPGTKFIYSSALTSTIYDNVIMTFDNNVTLSYDSSSDDRLVFVDDSSRLHFNTSNLHVAKDFRLLNGTLVLDNKVSFSIEVGQTLYVGNSNILNNMDLEFHAAAELRYGGNLVNANA